MSEGLRARILNRQDLRREIVEVPEWDCSVVVRELTYPERARYYRETAKQDAAQRALAEAIEEQGREMEEKMKSTALDEALPEKPEKKPVDPALVYEGIGASVEEEGRLAALLLRLGVIDEETGEQVFTDEDLPALEQKNPEVLERLATRIASMSGLTGGSVRSAEKNSETIQSERQSSTYASLSDPLPEN